MNLRPSDIVHIPALRFAAMGALLSLAAFLLPTDVTGFIDLLTARMAADILALAGVPPHLEGVRLTLGTYAAVVIDECTVVYPGVLFVAFLLASPASWRQRLMGAAVGLPLLNVVNVVRIALVVWLGSMSPQLAKYVHVYFGQVVMVLTVVAACYGWTVRVGQWTGEGGSLAWWVRLVLWSGVIFVPWVLIHRWYVRANDAMLRFVFSAFDHPILLTADLPLYFQTFNSVIFGALLMASRPSLRRADIPLVCTGLFILWSGHLAVRVANVLFSAFHLAGAYPLAIIVHILAQYLFPLVFWRLIVDRRRSAQDAAS